MTLIDFLSKSQYDTIVADILKTATNLDDEDIKRAIDADFDHATMMATPTLLASTPASSLSG